MDRMTEFANSLTGEQMKRLYDAIDPLTPEERRQLDAIDLDDLASELSGVRE